jgi:hypothetical protein
VTREGVKTFIGQTFISQTKIAQAVLFLIGDRAHYITGQCRASAAG